MVNHSCLFRHSVFTACVLLSACSSQSTGSREETSTSLQRLSAAGSESSLPDPALRDRIIYYVIPDRFSNGDPANDHGDYVAAPDVDANTPGEVLKHGMSRTARDFYHGGDLVGLTRRLDYVEKLGGSALWTTPVARNRAVAPDGSGAGYHGYWPLGMDQVDPHLGTPEEMKAYVAAAHARGMKVILDVVANHTADVISYAECSDCGYRSTPYTPLVAPEWSAAKSPAWLNDATNYNNRGNMNDGSFESITRGDFGGLDDLATHTPAVIDGSIAVFQDWIEEYGVDGFRLDAAKHVDDAFWRAFWPAMKAHAESLGKPDFHAYAEVFDSNPENVSRFTRELGLPAAQDFAFMAAARSVFSQGAPTDALRWMFEGDDHYIDPDSTAYYLTTMLSSHDSGRIGAFLVLDNPGASDAELLARDRLAHAFLLSARGIPAVYYGDEQGFTGITAQGDTDFGAARQDMFPSAVAEYQASSSALDRTYNKQIGKDSTPAADNFDPKHPLYQAIRDFARLRRAFPEFRRGAQLHRFSSAEQGGGIYAFSRIMQPNNKEILVALNTSEQPRSATIRTLHPNTKFVQPGAGADASKLRSDADGAVSVTLAPLELRIWMAGTALPVRSAAPSVSITSPSQDFAFGGFWIDAALAEDAFAEVSFFVQEPGSSEFRYLGVDDNAPYRVRYDASDLPLRAELAIKAVVRDHSGNSAESSIKTLTIENRLKDVTLVYQNGNQRSEFFSIRPSGQVGFPAPVAASGNTLPWPSDVDEMTFFYDTPNAGGQTFEFDQPIAVGLAEHVLPHARLAEDGLSTTLYVNNAGQIGPSPHDVASPPAVLESDGASTSPLPAPVYLRGEMNGWGAGTRLDYVGEDTFAGSVGFLSASHAYQFKFASEDWSSVNLGGNFNLPSGLWSGAGNLSSAVPEGQTGTYQIFFFSYPIPGDSWNRLSFYRFQKAAEAADSVVTFTVNAVPAFSGSQVVYVAGDDPALGGWGPGTSNALTPVSGDGGSYTGTYSGEIALERGQNVNFKFIVMHDGVTDWESGWSNRWFSVPQASTSSYTGTWNVIE
jgi:alpha-amylase